MTRARAGEFPHRITVERATVSQNEFGEPVKVWQSIGMTAAGISPLRGSERYRAMQTQSEEEVKIRFRYDSRFADLQPKDRITFTRTGKRYDLQAVMNIDERDRVIEIAAKQWID